jgi:hypothetical protein
MNNVTILTFQSVHQVIKADKLLAGQAIVCKIVPVPEQISSECGMCIETNDQNYQLIENLLNTQSISHQTHHL